MILTGKAIAQGVHEGTIVIEPFDPACVEPNSYGFHLGHELKVYRDTSLDACRHAACEIIAIGAEGYVLEPDRLYLGSTLESLGSREHAAELYARLSTSLCGIFIQLSAPLGHTGAIVSWTLEIMAAQRVRVYGGMLIGKICFWSTQGAVTSYAGRYQGSTGPVGSRLAMDFG